MLRWFARFSKSYGIKEKCHSVTIMKNSHTSINSRRLPLVKLKSNVLGGFENSSSNGSNFRTLGENGSTASSTLFVLLSNGPGKELA